MPYFLVIAHQGREIREHRQDGRHRQHHRPYHPGQAYTQRALPGPRAQSGPPQGEGGQYAPKQHMADHAQAEQLAGLVVVGCQDVANHRSIQVDGVAVHVVGRLDTDNHPQCEQGPHRPSGGKQAQSKEIKGRHQHRQGRHKSHIPGTAQVAVGGYSAPEGPVGHCQDIGCGKNDQELDRQKGASPVHPPSVPGDHLSVTYGHTPLSGKAVKSEALPCSPSRHENRSRNPRR